MLVQGSLAGDVKLILGSLKLHNPQLQQLGEVSQAVIFTGSKLLEAALSLGPASHKHPTLEVMTTEVCHLSPNSFLDTPTSCPLCSFTQSPSNSGTLGLCNMGDHLASWGSKAILLLFAGRKLSLWIYIYLLSAVLRIEPRTLHMQASALPLNSIPRIYFC